MKRFEGHVAIITGGGDGIGRATALRLGAEGAVVAICDINQDNLDTTIKALTDQGTEASAWQLDISEETAVIETFDAINARHAKIDVLVNSAGIVGPTLTNITQIALEDFDRVHAVNLRGSYITAKYALHHMETNDYGRIMLIASIAGKEGNPGMSPYATTKAGVIGLVKSLGKEYAETGIRVNGLAPAVIRTSMVDGVPDAQVQYMADKIPMKRLGTPEEVAALIAYVVSEENTFTTGFIYDVSGGRATY